MTRPGFLARTGPRAVVRTVFMVAALIVGEDAATAADTPQTLIDRMASERRDGRLNDAVETAHIAWDEVQREGRIDSPEGERLRGELRELAEALRASIDGVVREIRSHTDRCRRLVADAEVGRLLENWHRIERDGMLACSAYLDANQGEWRAVAFELEQLQRLLESQPLAALTEPDRKARLESLSERARQAVQTACASPGGEADAAARQAVDEVVREIDVCINAVAQWEADGARVLAREWGAPGDPTSLQDRSQAALESAAVMQECASTLRRRIESALAATGMARRLLETVERDGNDARAVNGTLLEGPVADLEWVLSVLTGGPVADLGIDNASAELAWYDAAEMDLWHVSDAPALVDLQAFYLAQERQAAANEGEIRRSREAIENLAHLAAETIVECRAADASLWNPVATSAPCAREGVDGASDGASAGPAAEGEAVEAAAPSEQTSDEPHEPTDGGEAVADAYGGIQILGPAEPLRVAVGGTLVLRAVDMGRHPIPGVIWASLDTERLQVGPTGVVAGIAPGTASVMARAPDGGWTTVEVEVTGQEPLSLVDETFDADVPERQVTDLPQSPDDAAEGGDWGLDGGEAEAGPAGDPPPGGNRGAQPPDDSDPWGLNGGPSSASGEPPRAEPVAAGDGWGLEEGGTSEGAPPGDLVLLDEQAAAGGGSAVAPLDDLTGVGLFGSNATVLDGSGGGPYHEFAALCRLGWAWGLASVSVGPADASIAQHLRAAGEHMMMANRTTFAPLRAWPSWSGYRAHYGEMADRLLRSQGGRYREQLAFDLELGWSGLADDLAVQMAGAVEHRENCDSHYARLGYLLCSGQQLLQVAAVEERDGDHDRAVQMAQDARQRLQGAGRELASLDTVRLASGACVDLAPVVERLTTAVTARDLGQAVAGADAAFQESLRLLGRAASPPVGAVLGSVSSSPWTWGANLNADVLLTVDRPISVTRVRQCKADWSPNPQPCLALSLTRELRGRQTAFCCAGLWLSSRIEVPGSGTVVIDWSPEARNQVPIPAGVTVNLGSLYLLAATQGDFDNDAVFALIEGVDGQGTPVSIQSSIFTPSDHFQNYLELCRSVGSSPSR